ncbi:MAG: hypothetical protein OHK0029_42220 [Armatimonadaceae bacterium]
MVTTTLVEVSESVRRAGKELLKTIDELGIDCQGLFWKAFSENDWRFFIVSQRVATEGIRSYLLDLHRAVDSLSEQDRQVILSYGTVPVHPGELVVRELIGRYGNVVEDRMVRRIVLSPEEAYIFRLNVDKKFPLHPLT